MIDYSDSGNWRNDKLLCDTSPLKMRVFFLLV